MHECLGCGTKWATLWEVADCEAMHLEEELARVGLMAEWRNGHQAGERKPMILGRWDAEELNNNN